MKAVEDSTVEAFRALFKGRVDAWGSVEGKSNKEPVTTEHYKKHLLGERSLGIYMLNDDSTCWFFAIDLDIKDYQKAIDIRREFQGLSIPVYIADSKSKGHHIYGFANEHPFVARDIRRLCLYVLDKLQVRAEIFPKQDYLDEKIPLGNYINLPCYGFTRSFITTDLKTVEVEVAVQRIRRIDDWALANALKQVPAPVVVPVLHKGKKRTKSNYPPCISAILKGVPEGSRDVAAFALARHLLDQQFTADEILGLLVTWDAKNKPPIGDQRQLATKIQSAQRGAYAFGCSSIMKEPLLSGLCVGEENCAWIQKETIERKKKGLIQEASFYESDTHLYEEILQPNGCVFLAYDKQTGEISYQTTIELADHCIVPASGAEITEGAVLLPTGVEEYGSTLDLVNQVKSHVQSYVDLDIIDLEFATWYIMMSWVYDKLSTVSYLHFEGDTGCGKSRSLDVIGRLAYKPMMMAGAVTPAPIYRLIRRFRGTLILEEADFRDSTEKGEVITILNSGFERFRPVIRCSQDNPDNLQVLPCYGPKVFATRYKFQDIALEARCLTFKMEETDREDIPPLLGTEFYERMHKLHNKLLLWRLRNYSHIDPGDIEHIDIGKLEPRLKQVGLPYAIPFKDYPDVMARFKSFMETRQRNIISERADSDNGKLVLALFKTAVINGTSGVYAGKLAETLQESGEEMSPQKVGKILRSLNIERRKRREAGKQAHFVVWKPELMRKLLRRYVVEPEEYQYLVIDVEV